MKFNKTKSGISLLIAVILIFILVTFGLTVTNLVIDAIRQSANVNSANIAYFGTEGGLEEGIYENLLHDAGYSSGIIDVELCGTQEECAEVLFEIGGQVPQALQIGGEYIIPTPGTGDVGSDCDPLKAVTNGDFYYSPDTTPHFLYQTTDPGEPYIGAFHVKEHPCNWGKMRVGDSITIPLYYIAGDNVAQNIYGPNDTFYLRIRTACFDGAEMCFDSARYALDTMSGDDTVVSWQITGESLDGKKNYILTPYELFDPVTKTRYLANTELYEGQINAAAASLGRCVGQYCVLSQGKAGVDLSDNLDPIIFFLNDQGNFFRSGSELISKPILKLSVIHSLQKDASTTIPYLEYQISSSSGIAPTDVAQTITAEGFSGEFKQVLEVRQPQESGLLEYVIQQ